MKHTKKDKLEHHLTEYDDRGNLIHRKTVDGYEQWYEYDNKGNIIHFKDRHEDGYGNEFWYKWGVLIKRVEYTPKKD